MHPPQERLHPDDRQIVQVVDGLVDEPELVSRKGGPEVVLEPDAPSDLRLHLRMEELEAVLPFGLGLVERNVRIAQELAARRPVADRDPDAGVGVEGGQRAVELEGLLHHIEEPFGHQFGGHHRVAPVDQDDEFVAAHAADRVRPPQGARQPGGDRHQQAVSGLVAEGIVDDLEIVDVDVQRGAGRPAPAIPGQELVDAVHDQSPVRQPRQGVMERLELKLVIAFVDEDPPVRLADAERVAQDAQQQAQRDAHDKGQHRTVGRGGVAVCRSAHADCRQQRAAPDPQQPQPKAECDPIGPHSLSGVMFRRFFDALAHQHVGHPHDRDTSMGVFMAVIISSC